MCFPRSESYCFEQAMRESHSGIMNTERHLAEDDGVSLPQSLWCLLGGVWCLL